MYCTNCGASIPDGAKFCPACGANASDHAAADQVSAGQSAAGQTTAGQSAPPPAAPAPARRKTPAAVRALVVCAAIMLVAAIYLVTQQPRQTSAPSVPPASVSLTVTAPNYDTMAASPIPLHVSGTDLSSQAVDRYDYCNSTTYTVELAPGDYTVEVAASPFLSDGSLYVVENAVASVTVSDQGQVTTPEDQLTLDLPAATPDQMTDDAIQAAVQMAVQGGMSEDDANDLAVKSKTRRDQLAAEQAAAAAVTASYSTQTLQAGKYTFSYVQLSRSDDPDAYADVNATLRQEAQAAADHHYDYEGSHDVIEAYQAFDQYVTYFQNGVAFIVTVMTKTNGGPHGWTELSTRCIHPHSADMSNELGMFDFTADGYSPSDALYSRCAEAFATFADSGQAPLISMSQFLAAEGNASQVAADESQNMLWFYVTPDGYYAHTGPYYMGDFASGEYSVPVCDLQGNPVANPVYSHEVLHLGASGSMTMPG